MSGTALFLVHDEDAVRGPAETGTLREHVEAAGLVTSVAVPGRDDLDVLGHRLLVVMGSEASAYDDTVVWLPAEMQAVSAAVAAGIPVLGVCFGGQLLARVLGGQVRRATRPERGFVSVTSSDPRLVAAGPWMAFHGDEFLLPPGAVPVAVNDACLQAYVHNQHLGVQFHPEISPAVFDAWVDSWESADSIPALEAAGLDVAALRSEIATRAVQARERCGRLFQAFWSRASTWPPGASSSPAPNSSPAHISSSAPTHSSAPSQAS